MEKHDPILLFVSRLLPSNVADDASALYAWCRRLDEIADNPDHYNSSSSSSLEVLEQLEDWQHRFELLCKGEPVDAMDAALYQCLQRNPEMGREPFVDMMAGMKADATEQRRIPTLPALETYGYQVAGTVGLMLLPLLKAPLEAKDPAIALGTAIQLVNILRDATPDAAMGRIYLPQDVLQAHGVVEEDVFQLALQQPPSPSQSSSLEGYCQVVKIVADRAEALLQEAEVGKTTLPGLGPLLVQIIIELYRGYLEQLETSNYNNLLPGGERVKISTGRKLAATLKAFAMVIQGR